MKIERKQLISILEKIKPGISTNNTLESMSYFLFSGKTISTYNDLISVQYPLKTDFSLFVKAEDLFKILSKTTVNEILLKEEKEKLIVSSKNFRVNLTTIKDEEITTRIKLIRKSLKIIKWKNLPKSFCNSILTCHLTASKNESEGTLTCVCIDGVDCVASDNKRISHTILDEKMDKMFIKASQIRNLVNIDPIEYGITKSWLHFKNKEGCIFSIRKIDGKFPDFLQFMEFKGDKIDFPASIMEGIDITSVLMDLSNPALNFKLSKNNIALSVKSEHGTAQYKSKMEYDGKEINFAINPEFLKEMMSHSFSIFIGEGRAKLIVDSFVLVTALFEG